MNLLNKDVDMIERMENDLREKITVAFATVGVSSLVHGVFSLDHLEMLVENSLETGKIHVGAQYHQAVPLEIDFKPTASAAPGQGTSAKLVSYEFLVILAVPTGPECRERYNATKLLTALRMGIQGAAVAEDKAQRRWNFQREKPEVGASTETMLYYSQLWQVSLVNTGPNLN